MSKIKQLDWCICSGHFGNSHMASTPIGDSYFIWITDGGFKCSTTPPNREHKVCGSLLEAKEYCQKDFERRINECIDTNYEQRFYRWLSNQGSHSIDKVGIKTLREVFDVMDEEENKQS